MSSTTNLPIEKTFSMTVSKKFKEFIGGYTIVSQLNDQVNLCLGRGTWYAKNYYVNESDDKITFSVDVVVVRLPWKEQSMF